MTSDEVRYETKTVHTVRGGEAKAKAKWQQAGWEFVEQTPNSMLRTKLTFRKPAPKRPPLLVLAGMGVLLIAGISIAAFFEEDDPADQTAAAPSVAATVEPPQSDVESPTVQPSSVSEPPSAAATQTAEPTVEAPATDPSQTLTVENSAELAALLAVPDPGSSIVKTFAADHDNALLEFDANIAFMSPHEGYETRFDLLIKAGDYSETSQTGPSFQFRDVNIVSDLQLNGAGIPDSIGIGQNIRIIARVDSYNPTQQLFFLEPVSTQIR